MSMALEVVGPTRRAAIAGDGEHVIARLPAELEIAAPICARIWERFYGAPGLTLDEVRGWRAELAAVRAAWETGRRAELVRERRINAQDPAVVARIVAPMLAGERTLVVCNELIAVCDDAVAAGVGLELWSD
jgi:hypothetical protein